MDRLDAPSAQVPESSVLMDRIRLIRSALLRAILLIMIVFGGLFPYANDIYEVVSAPIREHLPDGATMIATEVTSTFFAPFKLTIIVAMLLCMPFILLEGYGLLYPAARRHAVGWLMIVLSILLFFAGMAFAYYVAFPLIMGFFALVGPAGVMVTPDINRYLDIALKLLFAFGMAFEVPVITVALVRSGIVELETLIAKRAHVFLGCFVVGMFLTPPDMFSQTLLAIPMWLLFELGVLISRILNSRDKTGDESSPAGDGAQ